MENKEFTYEQMDELIKNGEAKVIKISQRKDKDGHYRY